MDRRVGVGCSQSGPVKPYEVIAATDESGLTPTERLVLIRVAMWANGTEAKCWVSVATMVKATGLSERTVQDTLKALVDLGVLSAEPKPGRTTEYTVHPDRIPPPQRLHPRKRRTPQELHPTPATSAGAPATVAPAPATVAPDLIVQGNLKGKEGNTPTASPGLVLLPPIAEAMDDPPTQIDPTPKWARGHKGVPAIDVLGAVVRAIESIRQRLVDAERCETDAKSVLSLWKANGRPPIADFALDVGDVAEWARTSPDAENDIRGIRPNGESWGRDRSRDVATICRHERWGDRLASAKAWQEAGCPATRHHPMKPARPFDPPRPPPVADDDSAPLDDNDIAWLRENGWGVPGETA